MALKSWGVLCGLLFLLELQAISLPQASEQTVTELVKHSTDAVVQVVVSDSSGKELGLGSGFILSPDGQIVTNYHVIKGAHSAIVKLTNGAFFPVVGVLAEDAERDLAILKVAGKNLPSLTLAEAERVQVASMLLQSVAPWDCRTRSPMGLSALYVMKATASNGFRPQHPRPRATVEAPF